MAKRSTTTRKPNRSGERAPSREQRDAAEAQRHAPIGLPSGASYDMSKLGRALDQVVDRNSDNRDAEVDKALSTAAIDSGTSTVAPNALPDHKVYRVETQLSAGTIVGEGKDAEAVGSQTVTEFRQVFDPASGGSDAPEGVPIGDVDADAGGRSSILGMTEVGGGSVEAGSAGTPDAVSVPASDGETGEPGTTTDADAAEASILAGSDAGETN